MPVDINFLTEVQKDIIGGVVRHRFYNRITERNVYDWLRNFEQEEVEYAIEILKHIEYYREDDIINILTEALNPYIIQTEKHLHFVPIGKAGKSGQMVVYIIQGVLKPFYAHRHRFHYYTDIEKVVVEQLKENDVLFYVDDVIGTGNTFVKYAKKNDKVRKTLEENFAAEIKLLCIVTTMGGKVRLERDYPSMKLIGEEKRKAFDVDRSCFGSYYRMLPIREFAFKYGLKIAGKDSALGYENSQLLIVFSHAVPNNSLPILWKQTGKFMSLAPRSYAVKGRKAFMDRNETNRWLFFFMDFFRTNSKRDVSQLFHDKDNYMMMSVLRLMLQGHDDLSIANQLGLHRPDMDAIWQKGVDTKLWNDQHQITDACQRRYQELLKQMRFENTAYNRDSKREEEKELVFVPETFRGLK